MLNSKLNKWNKNKKYYGKNTKKNKKNICTYNCEHV